MVIPSFPQHQQVRQNQGLSLTSRKGLIFPLTFSTNKGLIFPFNQKEAQFSLSTFKKGLIFPFNFQKGAHLPFQLSKRGSFSLSTFKKGPIFPFNFQKGAHFPGQLSKRGSFSISTFKTGPDFPFQLSKRGSLSLSTRGSFQPTGVIFPFSKQTGRVTEHLPEVPLWVAEVGPCSFSRRADHGAGRGSGHGARAQRSHLLRPGEGQIGARVHADGGPSRDRGMSVPKARALRFG